jgi:flagellar hook-basal body complex protein FliE
MRIDPISSATASVGPGGVVSGLEIPKHQPTGFASALQQSIERVADLQNAADLASQRVATGDLAHLHEAVIAMQEASLALDLVVSVRDHVVEGVQELLRTQV